MADKLQIPAMLKLRQQRFKEAIWRDALFLLAGAIAYFIVGFIETHASDDGIRIIYRGSAPPLIPNMTDCIDSRDITSCSTQDDSSTTPKNGILDAGFILASPIHSYLASHRHMNDLLAMWNSILLTIPFAYVVYVTLWKGDFRLSFKLIATHLFRSLCGWFTYLPPDPEFLSSMYDFPEVFLCLFQECSGNSHSANFVTFFSGHVATIVIIANHLYMAKHTRLSICLHVFNWLQAIRLLATRGHYSIDLIIGYVVAAFVSSPAERLGLYYSRGIQPEFPGIVESFEILVGVSVAEMNRTNNHTLHGQHQEGDKEAVPITTSLQGHDGLSSDDVYNDVQSETSARIAVDIVANIAQMKLSRSI